MEPPRPPTEHECEWFYNGLPSRPKLVARSSLTPFRFGIDGRSSDLKTLTVVGDHAIVDKWNDEHSPLRNQILGILRLQKVDWHAMDVLRIGYTGDEMPVIVSISVAKNTLSCEVGNQVAWDCRNALLEHGLYDVHCEVKESNLLTLASAPAVLRQDSHQIPPYYYSYMYQLSDQLGTSIASLDQPRREGTKGIYLRRTGGDPAEIFALTCRHVCYDESETGCLLPREESLPSKPVIQLPDKTKSQLMTELEGRKTEAIQRIQAEKDKGECYDNEGDRRSAKLARYQQTIAKTESFLQYFAHRKALETRVFGHVAYAREYAVQDSKFLSDWCLIRLKADSHERRLSELSNRVYVEGQDLKARFQARTSSEIRDLDHDGTLQIKGIVAVSELQDSKTNLIVGMRGRTSGLKFGLFNQVLSVTRRPFKNGLELVSQEGCIVAINAGKTFTKPGDSGACVFDLEGRAVGMVTGGINRNDTPEADLWKHFGLEKEVDVTYTTPMEWLLKDMKACGLSLEIV
ncbi:hypothetical protein CH063_12468 [Colletotrichum higginsianum]|uniref:Uncharacterized protein n=1 Tax=Colletotrichum higginsianum (strain IMI 349063) TaxID=759273 RepID=H1VQI1_COLHI|nr:hypothetical protein CH63R_14434 [Colletotrichum higginsianum IMI 349063]OBR02133.1 hypothetical protein CH63R_14434 [Colletotrichum higginsianum IMI 349063]CCF42487.1 hypothetical protein CH063_12468 [Colletotrichum higginsianum]